MSHSKTAIAGLNPETGICCFVGDQTEGSLMEAISQGLIIVPVTQAQARAFFGEAFMISASPVDRDAQVTALRESGLSIDGDNAYKRDLIDSIVGVLAFGKQGVNPPPAGHWGKQFWDIGRAEGEEKERLINQREAILLQARVWAGEAKTQQAITREVGEILGGVPNWGPIATGVGALRQQLDKVNAQLEQRVPLYEAINRAARELPDGWSICLNVERDGGGVELFDQHGIRVEDFPSDNERLDYTVNDAVDAALVAHHALQGGE